ncbi:ABC transporter ATP-binding protein [Parapusillimonas sp. SGNA-6]|nr:ABC transporter ATP-binding protein [Parapusillimonas sp. SGNA-6]
MSNTQAAQADTVLSVRNLSIATVSAHPKVLVDAVSFDVRAGETLCIVGESGSGKSLTSFSIMGLLPPQALRVTSGEVLLAGQDLLRLTHRQILDFRASSMSMVFQEPMTALNPVQRVGDQIDEVLRIHCKELSGVERRAKVVRMLADVGLPDPEKLYAAFPHQLSGGQRQRIMIAMALILEPKLLIADEPTTALDVTTQRQILALIKDLQRLHGTAVIFVTHDFGVVADIADRILVMRQGVMVEQGDCKQILSDPADPYTRALIASVPSMFPPDRDAETNEPLMRVRSLCKVYGKKPLLGTARLVPALNDINLEIRRNEVIGVVGESGSGKSTLARCMIGLVEASSGEITLGGQVLARSCRERPLRDKKRIQIVFQDPYRSLNPRLKIGDSLTEGLRNIGVRPQQALQKVTDVLAIVGLDASVLSRYPHQFSGGQRQRLCLARAIVMEPEILIADEAVSALDVLVQEQVLDLLLDIKKKTGVAIVFITHDLRVAAQISDRVVVMRQGCIIESGAPSEVISAPGQQYTRELIASAPGMHWDFKNFRAYA